MWVSDSRGPVAWHFVFWENRPSAFQFILPVGLVEAERKNCKISAKGMVWIRYFQIWPLCLKFQKWSEACACHQYKSGGRGYLTVQWLAQKLATRGSISGKMNRCFLLQNVHLLRRPPTLLCNGYRGPSLAVKRPDREPNHSAPSLAQLKNVWNWPVVTSIYIRQVVNPFLCHGITNCNLTIREKPYR